MSCCLQELFEKNIVLSLVRSSTAVLQVTHAWIRKYMSVVDQEDHLCPFLTVRESLDFAARFYMRESQEIPGKVEAVIKKLGLESCRNTRCGNAFFKVIYSVL